MKRNDNDQARFSSNLKPEDHVRYVPDEAAFSAALKNLHDIRHCAQRLRIYSRENPTHSLELARTGESFRSLASKISLWERDVDRDQRQVAFEDNKPLPWSETVRVLLCGTRDMQSPLSMLRGYEEAILRAIYREVVEFWRQSVILTLPSASVTRMDATEVDWIVSFQNIAETKATDTTGSDSSEGTSSGDSSEEEEEENNQNLDFTTFNWREGRVLVKSVRMDKHRKFHPLGSTIEDRPPIAFSTCTFVEFPKPSNINVNMMPFVMGDANSLPTYLRQYYRACVAECPVMPEEIGKVCYLTVAEGHVSAGDTQRRGGIHVEAPGSFAGGSNFVAGVEHRWGNGHAFSSDELHGGLFVASNMDGTCAVWNALIDHKYGCVDRHGSVEVMRPFLGEPTLLRSNELVWMTDRTPHEGLPQKRSGYRQFFRLVTSEISLWFEEHSTPNPKVPLPEHVKVIKGSKFDVDCSHEK